MHTDLGMRIGEHISFSPCLNSCSVTFHSRTFPDLDFSNSQRVSSIIRIYLFPTDLATPKPRKMRFSYNPMFGNCKCIYVLLYQTTKVTFIFFWGLGVIGITKYLKVKVYINTLLYFVHKFG